MCIRDSCGKWPRVPDTDGAAYSRMEDGPDSGQSGWASHYMEKYLKREEERAAGSVYGVVTATGSRVEELKTAQATSNDLLRDLHIAQKSSASGPSPNPELMAMAGEVVELTKQVTGSFGSKHSTA